MTTADKVKSFAQLKKGWNFGAGVPAPQGVIEKALQIERLGYIFSLRTGAFPADDGGISIIFYNEPNFFDILINPDLTIDWWWGNGIGANYVDVSGDDNVPLSVVVSNLFYMSLK